MTHPHALHVTHRGLATLSGGTVTVSTAHVIDTSHVTDSDGGTLDCHIQLTAQTLGGSQGMLSVGTITDGTSFVINSSNGADTSVIAWALTIVDTVAGDFIDDVQ